MDMAKRAQEFRSMVLENREVSQNNSREFDDVYLKTEENASMIKEHKNDLSEGLVKVDKRVMLNKNYIKENMDFIERNTNDINSNYSELDGRLDDHYSVMEALLLPKSGREFGSLPGMSRNRGDDDVLIRIKAADDNSGNANKCPSGVFLSRMKADICNYQENGARFVCDDSVQLPEGDVCLVGISKFGVTVALAPETSDTKLEISAAPFCKNAPERIMHFNGDPYKCVSPNARDPRWPPIPR